MYFYHKLFIGILLCKLLLFINSLPTTEAPDNVNSISTTASGHNYFDLKDDEVVNTSTEQSEITGREIILKCEQCGISNTQRIIGGEEASANEFPWMAQLRSDNGYFCGGTLIGNNYVLSAAHCFTIARNNLRVVLGAHRLSSKRGVVERKVISVTVHPEFDAEKGKAHDVAILKLDNPLTFSRTIRPVCLPSNDQQYIGRNGTVAGWGRTALDNPLSDRLVKLNLPIISEEECRRNWYKTTLPPGTLCAGYQNGKKDSCFGDSGSPLMADNDGIWYQVGIVSWGAANSCALTYGVYARITAYLEWIVSNTADDECFSQS